MGVTEESWSDMQNKVSYNKEYIHSGVGSGGAGGAGAPP